METNCLLFSLLLGNVCLASNGCLALLGLTGCDIAPLVQVCELQARGVQEADVHALLLSLGMHHSFLILLLSLETQD